MAEVAVKETKKKAEKENEDLKPDERRVHCPDCGNEMVIGADSELLPPVKSGICSKCRQIKVFDK